jgi:pimeloyl-ACP methyl ester carboxylesterase
MQRGVGTMDAMTLVSYERPARSRLNRAFRGAILILVLLLIVGHVVAAFLFSSWIHDTSLVAGGNDTVADGAVIALEGDRVTIRTFDSADDDPAQAGMVGFNTGSGYLRLGMVLDVVASDVTRTFELVGGSSPVLGATGSVEPTGDEAGRLHEDLGIEESSYIGPLGPMDATIIEGNDTWVIHIHDQGAGLDQSLRMMQILEPEGFTHFAITYRNDPGQPTDESGLTNFGVTERDDVAAAIDHARAEGATTVFVAGYGSGGAIAVAQMYRDPEIAALVLDGPVLDAESAMVHRAASAEGIVASLPITALKAGTVAASLRYGISWDTTDYLARSDQLVRPVLILHGTEDIESPIEDSRELAAAHPDVVTLVEVEGAGADRTWNLDPDAYGAAVLDFLDRVRAGS